MPLLNRKGILAIAAVLDVALHSQERPVSAKALADRHRLPSRHLEPVLQALVRAGILRGMRGPHGGYALGRERRNISVEQILRAARNAEDAEEAALPDTPLLSKVILPALSQAEEAFAAALGSISVGDMAAQAEAKR
ncbi:MAG TPA: Rrf2 family transcriptional regulator [Pseudolabrys sp.]|nr:Rrf2 family transcriptional regulator [Pseudolabrys sp.]